MIPLFHDFTDETVLVFGGGPVGARKARRFAREARVVVVSPAFADRAFGGADLVRAAPAPGDVGAWLDRADPALVVAATDDPEVNAAVARAAREREVLVNRTDESGSRDAGSVVVPATVRDDPVAVAVSTGGTSPALSKHLRERLEADLDGAGAMAELTADIRADLQARGVAPDRRRDAVRAVVRDERVWKALDTGPSKAKDTAADVISDVRGEPS
ncbi:siroheme synthase [Halobacteriales archaeon QS_1_68_17]|nr:MAG: siroheme synthase [Halobacteriales archaeon QS_1_68_17]